MKINNMSNGARYRKFIVFRVVDGANWFYDAWDDFEMALNQAVEVKGRVVQIEAVEV